MVVGYNRGLWESKGVVRCCRAGKGGETSLHCASRHRFAVEEEDVRLRSDDRARGQRFHLLVSGGTRETHRQECLCHRGSCTVGVRCGMLRRRLLEPPLLIQASTLIRDEENCIEWK